MKKSVSTLTVLAVCFLFAAKSYSQFTSVSISSTTVTCHGGSNGTAEATPVDGTTGPYVYEWSTTPIQTNAMATGLVAGDYTVTVTDVALTTITATVTIIEPSAVSLSFLSQSNVTCYGGDNGAASVNPASGGVGSYVYDWTPNPLTGDGTTSISGSAANYTCLVTDGNSCTATQTFAITQPAQIVVSAASQTTVSCNGGSNGAASVSVSGGTVAALYSYNWTPGTPAGYLTSSVSGLTAAIYTCTVTDDNSCIATKTFAITEPSVLVVSTASQTIVSCNGGSNGAASVSVTGGTAAYTYDWTPGNPTGDGSASVTGLIAQVYTCTVTDAHSCAASTKTFSITQPNALVVSPVSQTTVTCNAGNNGAASVSVSGGTTSYTYNWTPGNPTGDGSASVTNLTAATYTCTVTDAHSCIATQTFSISQPVAISLTTASQTTISCNGGSNGAASVNAASGGVGSFSYDWKPGNPTGNGTTSITGLIAATYTCTVTDDNSCTATKTFAITEPNALVVSVASQTTVSCNGGSNGAASVSVTGGTAAYTYDWTPGNPTGDGSASVTGLIAQVYTCTVTDAHSCAASTKTFSITQPSSALVVSAAGQTTVSCNAGNNGAASVSVSGGTTAYGYNWTPGNPTGDGTASVTNLTAATYTCTVTDANSCTATQVFSIIQPSALVVSTVGQTTVSCNGGNNGAASVSVSGGTTSYAYDWTPGNPTGDGTASVTNLIAATYTCTVTDGNSCTATKTFAITEPSALSLPSLTKTPGCNGVGGTATANPSGGTTPYTYAWLPSGGTSSAVTGLINGTHTVTVTDAHGCTPATQTVNISVSSTLTLTTTQTDVLCNGGKGTATVTVSGGTPNYTYSWNTSPVQNTANATGLSATSYTATVTDANGCTNKSSVTIIQPAVLTVTAAQTASVSCRGGSNGAATATTGGGTSPYTYAWLPSGGTSSAATGLLATNYTVIVMDANSCSATSTVAITQPTASVSITSVSKTTGCNGVGGTATVNSTGGTTPYTYAWLPSGATSSAATGLVNGNHTVTVTDAHGCTPATQTVSISVSPAITLTITSTNILCNGGKGTATVTVSGGTPNYTYSWNTSPVQNTANATGLSATSYTATVTDANGCTKTSTVTITQPAVLTLTVTKTNILCKGANNGTGTVSASGGTSPYTYLWTGGQTTSTATGLSVGGYTVTVTDANGCTKNGSINIIEPNALLTTISQSNACNSGLGTATVNVSGGTLPYTYSWNSSPVQTTQTAVGLPVGNYSVLVTDANGCTTFNAVAIVQLPIINLTTSQTTIACNGGKATVTANATGGSGTLSYLWAPGGQSTSVVSGLSAGSYSVTVSDANLCSVTNTLTITQPAALTMTVTKSNVICNGGKGSAAATLAGGTPPYTYAWTTTPVQTTAMATGLGAGNYTLTVTDANGCTKTGTTTITQPPALISSTSQFHIYDGTTGSSTASVSGGVPGYTYNWNTTPFQSTPTATGLYEGSYTLTVTDANGCTNKNVVTIISTRADRLAAGFDYSLSKCQTDVTGWGRNQYGQLGDGTVVSKDTAIVVTGLTNVTVLDCGGTHSLALKNDGNVWVWGRNANGQLGLGNVTDQHAPVLLSSLNKAIAIGGGNNHSLALKNDGTVWTWGLNTNGQLGDNTVIQRTAPVNVGALSNVVYVAGGLNHSLAILNDSTVWAWGANASGQLGDKSTTEKHVPVKVKNISGIVAVDGGNGHSLALKNDGTVWAWGLNADGQLGDGTNINKDTAVKVVGLSGIIAISAGDKHSLALRNDGTVWAWGLNTDGQLGDVTNASRNLPVNVNGLIGITSIQAGGNHSLAVKNNGQVWAWGRNADGQLGNKSSVSKNIPVMTHMPCLIKNLAVTTTQVNVKCNGGNNGSATAMPAGGALPYKYSWSTSPVQTTQTATGLSTGNYTVTVTDANTFASTVTLTITQPFALTTSVTASNVTCFGANNGTASVIVNGGTPNYQYVWNSVPNQTSAVATGLKPGIYTAYVTDANSCNVTTTITITQPSTALAINVVGVINATSCANTDGSIITTTSGGVPNYSYAWSTTPVQTTATAAGLGQGTYTLTVTDANNCTKSISQAVTCPTGINQPNSEIEFSVYPNPSRGIYKISSVTQSGTFNIEVYTLLGEKIYSSANLNIQSVNEIDISQQPEGVYFLHIITKDGANKYQDVVKKIIKD